MLCNVIETSVSKGVYLLKACMCLLAEANWCCTIESFRPQVAQRIINVCIYDHSGLGLYSG